MAIQHHPHDATLMSYAAGSLPEALSAVVASHVAHCPHCRAHVAAMEDIGAALLQDLPSGAFTKPAANPCNVLLGETDSAAASAEDGDVPAPLRGAVGARLEDIPWRRLGFGVWHHPIKLSAAAKGDLRLLKIAPGTVMPEHGHGGAELTLLLDGSYHDEIGTFRRGDVADLDDDVEHRPVADAKTGCICLVASESKARFKSLLARLVQPLTGM